MAVLLPACDTVFQNNASAPALPPAPESPFKVSPLSPRPEGGDADHIRTLSFTQIQDQVSLTHTYINGETGRSLIVETIGGGAGWLDYDNDGWWDLGINQGGNPTVLDRSAQPSDRLFKNVVGTQFLDVTEAARIVEQNYSQAIAVGDFDNDGFDDFYVSNVFANTLWHNCGDGTFLEKASSAGVADARWSCSAAWTDLDLDGDLDLYVCNYTQYDPTHPVVCKDTQGRDALCTPGELEPASDACFFNQGDGTFLDQAVERGLAGPGNRALGVASADFNNDGLPDIYVANDTTENFLFVNQGQARFEDRASTLGCAVDREGNSQASMGVAVADVDHNGFLDIYCTNYFEESNTLYANFGPRGFQDVTALTGLHRPTLAYLGFGTVLEDFDQDGRIDLFVANGHVNNAPSNPNQKMKAQIFSLLDKRWIEVGSSASDYFQAKRLGRGVAAGDYDNDGDLDLVVVNQNDPTVLLRNDSQRGHWLKLGFHGSASNRRGIGCRVSVTIAGRTLMQELCGGTSYASNRQPTCVFGLGSIKQVALLEVRWPSGKIQKLSNVSANQSLVIQEPD